MHNIFSNRKLLMGYIAWWTVWFAMHFSVNQIFVNSTFNNLVDAVFSTLSLAIFSFAISLSLRYYKPNSGGWINLVVWILVFTLVWYNVNTLLVKYFCNETAYIAYIDNSGVIRFVFGVLNFTCFVLLNLIWNYLLEKQEETQRKNKLDEIAREVELNNLRQQLQPHFLFNSLNSINALTISSPEQARDMVGKLSEFLRGTLKKEHAKFITLEEELAHLSLYLQIEKVRFGYRLNTVINCEDNIINSKIPPLLLQPVIENAIKYGLYDTLEPVTIQIDCKKERDNLKIEVSNPFDPLTSINTKGTGFGLKSIKRRLSLIFNRTDLLSINQTNNLFTTTIIIPQKND